MMMLMALALGDNVETNGVAAARHAAALPCALGWQPSVSSPS